MAGLSGTGELTKSALTACVDRRSLPTNVHVRPANINCNSLRAEFSNSNCNQRVLIGNWSEQRIFDKVTSVDPNPKMRGTQFNKTESCFHDRICPPTMGGVAPRYQTESRCMSDWLPAKLDVLPEPEECTTAIGKPLVDVQVDMSMYETSSGNIGQMTRVRF